MTSAYYCDACVQICRLRRVPRHSRPSVDSAILSNQAERTNRHAGCMLVVVTGASSHRCLTDGRALICMAPSAARLVRRGVTLDALAIMTFDSIARSSSADGYGYSSSVKGADVTWDEDALMEWLLAPKKFIKVRACRMRSGGGVTASASVLALPLTDRTRLHCRETKWCLRA